MVHVNRCCCRAAASVDTHGAAIPTMRNVQPAFGGEIPMACALLSASLIAMAFAVAWFAAQTVTLILPAVNVKRRTFFLRPAVKASFETTQEFIHIVKRFKIAGLRRPPVVKGCFRFRGPFLNAH